MMRMQARLIAERVARGWLEACPHHGFGDVRLSTPKHNGRRYLECRVCDKNVKQRTRHLLRIEELQRQGRRR